MPFYNFHEDESWTVGTVSIQKKRKKYMRTFRMTVSFSLFLELNALLSWWGLSFIVGGMSFWVAAVPSFPYILRIMFLFFTLIFEQHPYKIATSERIGDRHPTLFPKGQYRFLRRIGAHGAHGPFGWWCAIAKFIHCPVAIIAAVVFFLNLVFHSETDHELALVSLTGCLGVLFVTYMIDYFIVDWGVIHPRETYLKDKGSYNGIKIDI